jgi:23S rRNA pseudouridine1911/1915/1917 synthase
MSSKYFSGKSREALTEWIVEERFALGAKARAHPFATLLRLRPHTGRTHQIRVHLADSGHPLVGDRIYGKKRKAAEKTPSDDPVVESFPRHALHAEKLTVNHVRTGQPMQFVAPLPKDLSELLRYLRTPKGESGRVIFNNRG